MKETLSDDEGVKAEWQRKGARLRREKTKEFLGFKTEIVEMSKNSWLKAACRQQ